MLRKNDVRTVDLIRQIGACEHLRESLGNRLFAHLHAGRTINADILVVNKQKFGLFFDLIHYLRHFHLLHINSHTACLRPDGPGGKAQKRSKKGDYQVL